MLCQTLIGSSGFYLHGSRHLSRQSAKQLWMKGESKPGVLERERSVAAVSDCSSFGKSGKLKSLTSTALNCSFAVVDVHWYTEVTEKKSKQ